MRIGELATETGVSVRALRHYEDAGLLTASRSANGYREYDAAAVLAVRRIRALIDAGLPTRIIREVLPHLEDLDDVLPPAPCDYLLEQVARQRDLLDRRASELRRNRDALDDYLRAASRARHRAGV